MLDGCQGKPQISVKYRICPQCGNEIEIFSIDAEAVCENCGFTIYNDVQTCAQWCQYARQCFGDEVYESLVRAAKVREEHAAAVQN